MAETCLEGISECYELFHTHYKQKLSWLHSFNIQSMDVAFERHVSFYPMSRSVVRNSIHEPGYSYGSHAGSRV